tara:strand:- start:176 stop:415 length:240 start_codon:yes stop_codon:yes gene_type:complete
MRTHKVGGTRWVDGRYEIYEEQVQFTAQEELVRDAEEAQAVIDMAAREELQTRQDVLEAKLADDSISFDEMKELMRLRG